MTAARTRADIEAEARRYFINYSRPDLGLRHTCRDRDWCDTKNGCGASFRALAALRETWRTAR